MYKQYSFDSTFDFWECNNCHNAVHLRSLLISDARLFCKNKQVNLKNKPKTGNLTEKQAQHPLAWKFNKTKKSAKKLNKKAGRQIRKTSPKWGNFHKNTPNMPLAVNWKSKSAIKFEKKAIRKTEICKKQTQKTNKFQFTTSAKTSNPQALKKTATAQTTLLLMPHKTQSRQTASGNARQRKRASPCMFWHDVTTMSRQENGRNRACPISHVWKRITWPF